MELLLVGFLKIPRHQAAAAGHVINNNNIKKEVNYGKFNDIGIEGQMSCMSMTELMHTKAFSTRKVSVISYLIFFSDMIHLEGSTISKDFLDTVVTT